MSKELIFKKSAIFLLVLVMVLSLFSPIALADNMTKEVIESIESAAYGKKAIEHTIYLSTGLSGPRKAGTEYEIEAANYIKGEFERIGYGVKMQDFSFERKGETYNSQNVIAIKEGKSHEQIIVGAHYDQVDTEGSKGAHDNASGIAAVLETAERLKDVDTNYTIVFIAFGAEEAGLKGSSYYVNSMTEEEIEKTVAMVNLDSIIAGDYIYMLMQVATK